MRGAAVALVAALGLAACAAPKEAGRIAPTTFAELPGWDADRLDEALPALLRSCGRLMKREDARAVGPEGLAGTVADWKPACVAAAEASGEVGARRFFETWFVPFEVAGKDGEHGLFTGYYEPELAGAGAPDEGYPAAIYRRPPDVVTVDLGEFRADFEGESIVGRVVDGRLKPYLSRAEIEAGGLAGRNLELFWLADPVDAFFLQIQGSGRLKLADGAFARVGYDGQNGRPYHAIGKTLVERGALAKDGVSAQAIMAWLRLHPGEAAEVMNLNHSYVFFRAIEGDGPVGAQGVALTPLRSLAVDPAFMPLGAPVWLDTVWPEGVPEAGRRLRRLVVTQDTGGAIKGAVRGDLFWGTGDGALAGAGTMKEQGRYFLLLPRTVAERRALSS